MYDLYMYIYKSFSTMLDKALKKNIKKKEEMELEIRKHKPSEMGAAAAAAKSLQSCLTLCDPIDGSPPGSPIPGILQARTLEWVAIAFSSA